MNSFKINYIVLMIIVVLAFNSCTVVKHGENNGDGSDDVTFYFESEDFDASVYVEENWDSKIYPEIVENAVDLSIVIQGLKNNKDETISKYGIRKSETDQYSFIVKGPSTISELDRSSSAGLLVLENGCKIQIGPVIKKSMIRDVLSFVNFGDFANQLEYANISREINIYVRDNVVNSIDSSFEPGNEIDFYGVFKLDDIEDIVITPVLVEKNSGEL